MGWAGDRGIAAEATQRPAPDRGMHGECWDRSVPVAFMVIGRSTTSTGTCSSSRRPSGRTAKEAVPVIDGWRRLRIEAPSVATGTVKFFNDEKGYGFISREGDKDLFVHYSNIVGTGRRTLLADQLVEFEVAPGKKGDEAVNVRVL
jgi:CspA family cold shock protein